MKLSILPDYKKRNIIFNVHQMHFEIINFLNVNCTNYYNMNLSLFYTCHFTIKLFILSLQQLSVWFAA